MYKKILHTDLRYSQRQILGDAGTVNETPHLVFKNTTYYTPITPSTRKYWAKYKRIPKNRLYVN